MTGMGVVRLGPAPLPRAETPLHWNVQRRQLSGPDGVLVWCEPRRSPDRYITAEAAFAGLWERRKGARPVRIPGGLEFDAYPTGCAPCPELQTARVRVIFETPEGVAFDA